MNIYSESITEYEFLGFRIRCWRQEKIPNSGTILKTKKEVEDHFISLDRTIYKNRPNSLAESILSLDRMNAVEVKGKYDLAGCVLYKDWP